MQSVSGFLLNNWKINKELKFCKKLLKKIDP